jgi:multiple sugar transport system permease protein
MGGSIVSNSEAPVGIVGIDQHDSDVEVTFGSAEADREAARSRKQRKRKEGMIGWLFVSPVLILLTVFLIIPILLALYVSFTKWNGQGGPFSSQAKVVGLDNYKALMLESGLTRKNFVSSLRNNFYFVIFVVPLQTLLALGLALVLNQRRLKAKSFFRTAFYIPSLSSSIAIGLIFVFLFANTGAVNSILGWFGVDPIQWVNNSTGIIHAFLGLFGVDTAPGFLANHGLLGMSLWEWLSGPSWSMFVIIILATWTTSGTFMLLLLAGLQTIPHSVNEAAAIDGASKRQTLRYLTLPMLKKQIVLVITLGLIGTWQVFDQIYIMSDGAGNTVTPAYLSYTTGIREGRFGAASALAFIVFAIILVFTAVQRYIGRDKGELA